ncbi:MAG TPA: 50S ribosomal protein L22 [Candidatus Levybacteria bacterium]|nr:50S ribosomal protein L22 [Candidatus Levybacteria bacterium]
MEYKAEAKNIKMSPRKVRLVADSVRDLRLDQALASLTVLNKRASDPIRKTLESAVANAVNNFQASRGDLVIKEIMIGEGIMYKRYHYAARGRVRPYLRRTSHIRVILEDQIERTAQATKAAEQAVVAMTTPVEKKEAQKTEKKAEKKTKGKNK